MKVTIVIYKFTTEIYKSIRKLYMRNKSKTEHIYNCCLIEKGIYDKYVSKKIYNFSNKHSKRKFTTVIYNFTEQMRFERSSLKLNKTLLQL